MNRPAVIEYVGEFQLSVTRALRDQLLKRLDELSPSALSTENIDALSRRGGVYQLFEDEMLVYVGKSTSNLPSRLAQHRRKLSGRHGNLLDRVTFRCVYVTEDLDAMAPEKMLIATLRNRGQAAWNQNGFGNKDPGQQRDTSLVQLGHFDRLFPIDLDRVVDLDTKDIQSASDLAHALKSHLPYNFRFPTKGAKAGVLRGQVIDTLSQHTARPVREWFGVLADALPPGWCVIELPGYVIAYPDIAPSAYMSRTGAWEAKAGGASYTPHKAQFSDGEVEPEAGPLA